MDIGAIIGGIVENVGGVIGIVTNPVESIKTIAIGAACIFPALIVFGSIFKIIDDVIIYIDDMVIDKIPFKPVKNFFQGKLIDRLKKRVKRYEELIVKISD